MKTASLIQFNRIIFRLTFTLAPAARPLVPPLCLPPLYPLTPLAASPTAWRSLPVACGVGGGREGGRKGDGGCGLTAAMGQHAVDLPCLVLARLVASSSSGFPVCCAHCLPAARTHAHTLTHTHTESHSTSHAHRGLANPVTSGHVG